MTGDESLPSVHQEWLLALLGSPKDYDPKERARYARTEAADTWLHSHPGASDVPWVEVVATGSAEEPDDFWNPPCPVCNSGKSDAELGRAKWKARQVRGRKLWLKHVLLPPAIQAAGPKGRVGYWFDRCYGCDTVFYLPDDGQFQKAAAA